MSETIKSPNIPQPSKAGHETPVVSIDTHESFRRDPVTTEDLYHSPERIESPYLPNGIRTISAALGNIDEALELLSDGDKVGADDAMQHYQVLLPQLFACRSIGEGFALVTSSLQNAVSHLRGEPMNEAQIRSVRATLVALRSEPFMTFDASLEYVSRLERVGFNVDPPKFDYLVDLLSE